MLLWRARFMRKETLSEIEKRTTEVKTQSDTHLGQKIV